MRPCFVEKRVVSHMVGYQVGHSVLRERMPPTEVSWNMVEFSWCSERFTQADRVSDGRGFASLAARHHEVENGGQNENRNYQKEDRPWVYVEKRTACRSMYSRDGSTFEKV